LLTAKTYGLPPSDATRKRSGVRKPVNFLKHGFVTEPGEVLAKKN